MTPLFKKCYELYFGCKVGDQIKKWAPHICSVTCVKRLTQWAKGSRHMNFAIPMVWREPQDHSLDCHFCITQIKGISSKSKHTVKYPNLPSAMRPVPHSEDLPIPHPPTHLTLEDEPEHEAATEVPNNATFETSTSSCEPHLLTHGELNDNVRDLKLSKKQAKRLGSRLTGWNPLQKDTKVCFFCNRQEEFQDRALIQDGNFEDVLSQIEKSAWKSFKSVVKKS